MACANESSNNERNLSSPVDDVKAEWTPCRGLPLEVPQDAHQAEGTMATFGYPRNLGRLETNGAPPVLAICAIRRIPLVLVAWYR